MRFQLLKLAALVPFVFSVNAESDTASKVVVLSKDNFSEFVKSEPLSLIEFYAPWCGHCQKLEPHYNDASIKLDGEVKLAKVDCTVETELCKQFNIGGFPTLKVFENESHSEYKGTRETEGIVSYMKRLRLPKIQELERDAFDKFVSENKVAVVAFTKDKEAKEFKLFEKVAKELFLTYSFGYTPDAAAASKAGFSQPSIVLYLKSDDKKVVFNGPLDEENLVKFIGSESLPLMGTIGPDNYAKYVDLGLPIAYYFADNDEQNKFGKESIEPLAKEFKGNVSFVYIGAQYKQHGEMLGCEGDFPWFTIQRAKENKKYPLHGKLTAKAIREHVQGVLSGKIPSYIKSEPIPEKNEDPVKVVVAKIFSSLVFDKTKDVFLEVYAPWCGHCKKLAPIWDELGKAVQSIDEVIVAKMDGTANDLPADAGFEVQGFPTLVLIKAESNEVVNFEGDRTLKSLLEFLKKKATHGNLITIDESAEKPAADVHDEL